VRLIERVKEHKAMLHQRQDRRGSWCLYFNCNNGSEETVDII